MSPWSGIRMRPSVSLGRTFPAASCGHRLRVLGFVPPGRFGGWSLRELSSGRKSDPSLPGLRCLSFPGSTAFFFGMYLRVALVDVRMRPSVSLGRTFPAASCGHRLCVLGFVPPGRFGGWSLRELSSGRKSDFFFPFRPAFFIRDQRIRIVPPDVLPFRLCG